MIANKKIMAFYCLFGIYWIVVVANIVCLQGTVNYIALLITLYCQHLIYAYLSDGPVYFGALSNRLREVNEVTMPFRLGLAAIAMFISVWFIAVHLSWSR